MQPVVFAAGLDWLEGLLPFLFVLFWIVSQIVNVVRNMAGRGQPAPGPARVPPRPELPPRPQPALTKREQPRPAAAPAGGARGTPVVEKKATTPQPPRAAAPQLGSLGDHGGDIARHVRDAFADDLGHRSSPLKKPAAATAEPAAARPAATLDVVSLLRDPAALRQLFIVREVLERPVDRWL
jgi:hypothetical protein